MFCNHADDLPESPGVGCFADAVNSPYVTATFFAPTNTAFAALLHSFGITMDRLLADPSMCAMLPFLVVPFTPTGTLLQLMVGCRAIIITWRGIC